MPEEMQQALRKPVEFSGKAAADKTNVSAFTGVIQPYRSADLFGFRECVRWHERVVFCVED